MAFSLRVLVSTTEQPVEPTHFVHSVRVMGRFQRLMGRKHGQLNLPRLPRRVGRRVGTELNGSIVFNI